MGVLKKLFQQTAIYGIATVLPRILSIVLVPLYVSVLGTEQFGIYASLMAFLILGNVVLSYGMETAFFRFINKEDQPKKLVQSTALTSLVVSTLLFVTVGLLFKSQISNILEFRPEYILYAVLILGLDALCVIPFVWYRANERPTTYTIIKVGNVLINLGFNLFFFLWLPVLVRDNTDSIWNSWYLAENKVGYVFIANLIASGLTFLFLLPIYLKINLGFNASVWKRMMAYGLPVLVAGIAFSINEAFDKILLKYMLPEDIAESEVGIYSACYKLGVFMTLFATAFRLGIEPFFFNHASSKNAKETYALITKFFVIFGSLILLVVVVFIDVFKVILIPDSAFWEALHIVPIILLANLCLGIYHNLSVWYKVTDRTRFGAIVSIVGAGITLVLNLLLIPLISYNGSAIATLAAYGVMMILSYTLGKKYYPVPYDMKNISVFLILSIVFSYLSFYTFDRDIALGSLLLLIFLSILYFLERKEIKRYFKF
ncbi:lipopolysaccharide biosynthesis protein [Aegicerativicinus sediminis]|uniref:lipopolysaccharide biosynthesis protein n=1 Tax=Aegicerativicinus sediminis TaxID=2893202 RepID=UPI001E4BCB79|nr:oligosaccharide flippase family protein [Aegicerativicinus sediminis]